MLKLLLQFFSPFLFLSFAAGAPALTEGGGDAGADDGAADYGLGEPDTTDTADVQETESTEVPAEEATEERPTEKPEDREASDFKGQVARRITTFAKQSPSIAQAFKDNPEFKNFVEATARRDLAFRELYPTVAEARQMREQFPNGMQDVQQLMSDLGEVEKLDSDFMTRDRDGNFPGHRTIIDGMFSDNREAAVALFKTLPREWARLDPDSYRDVMGQIVGATLNHARAPQYLQKISQLAKDNPQIKDLADELLEIVSGYSIEKPAPTEEERRIQSQRAQLTRETEDRKREDSQRFNQNFIRESRKLQMSIISAHPAIKALEKVQALSPEKRTKIQEEVRSRIERHLSKSTSFMRKLRDSHGKGDLKGTIDLQKVQWNYPWVLNKFVREVMLEETPNLVQQNRTTAVRRAAPVKQTEKRDNQPTAPYQKGNRWYRPNGTPYSISEVLRGEHLK